MVIWIVVYICGNCMCKRDAKGNTKCFDNLCKQVLTANSIKEKSKIYCKLLKVSRQSDMVVYTVKGKNTSRDSEVTG